MRFEWDEAKNKTNIVKHRIDFSDVPNIFDHPVLVDLDVREYFDEDRWIGIGLLRDVIIVVIFIERDDDTIRIISARRANYHERKRYEQAIAD